MIWNELPQHREPSLKLSLNSPLTRLLWFTEPLPGFKNRDPRVTLSLCPCLPFYRSTSHFGSYHGSSQTMPQWARVSVKVTDSRKNTLRDASILHSSNTEGVLATLPDPHYKKQKTKPLFKSSEIPWECFLSFKIGILPICKYMYQKSENIHNLETEWKQLRVCVCVCVCV